MPKACCQSVADFRQTNTRLSVGPPVGRRLVDNRLPVGQRLTCPPQSAIRPPTVTGRSRVGQRFTFGMLSVISPACRDRCGLCQPAPAVRVSRRCPMYPSRPTGARRRTVSPSRAGREHSARCGLCQPRAVFHRERGLCQPKRGLCQPARHSARSKIRHLASYPVDSVQPYNKNK